MYEIYEMDYELFEQTIKESISILQKIDSGEEATIDGAVTQAIKVYRQLAALKKEVDSYVGDIQGFAKGVVSDVMVEVGETDIKTPSGRAYIPAPGVSIKYDAKALDALAASDPQLKAVIDPHRIVSERPGNLTIK